MMDLSSMLNDGPAPQKRTSSQASAHLLLGANGTNQPPAGLYLPPRPESHTPLYGPPSATPNSAVLTPLKTPSQTPAGNQYPFPTQPSRSSDPYVNPNPNYPLASPSQYGHPLPTLHHTHSTASHSPTPSSHPSQTPHSLRQSPLTTFANPPGHHYSQPTTPLGPPPLIQRTSTAIDRTSPFHQRTLSGASNSMITGSPAQHHPSIGNLVESPSAYNRPPSQGGQRVAISDRERSVSVSPKTKVPPRLSSTSSSHRSSQQDMHGAGIALPNNIVQNKAQAQSPTPPLSAYPQASRSPADVAHVNGRASSSSHQPPPEHKHHKIGLHQLPSPNNSQPPVDHMMDTDFPNQHSHHVTSTTSKRPADGEAPEQQPSKRSKQRKYRERPIWAQLGPNSRPPRQQDRQQQPAQSRSQPPAPSQPQSQPPPQPQPAIPHANGLPQAPPIDHNLLHVMRVLGRPWERTMKGSSPIPNLVAIVSDWLFASLDSMSDIGNDPMEGAIEIEAKIGTLIDQNSGLRCNLPVVSSTVIDPNANNLYRFESQMTMLEHRKMNEYLNHITRASVTDKGRIPVAHKHLRENDSFRTLSDEGIRALPQAVRNRRPHGRELKLRTTVDDATGQIKARITKIPLGHLHIFSPRDAYDCRISINLELNLNRSDIDPDALVLEPTLEKPAPPDRHKDRMSYRHQAYTVDLTRVDVPGVQPKFELECEIDAHELRAQMDAARAGAPHVFSDLVEGFLDNCAILMRQGSQ